MSSAVGTSGSLPQISPDGELPPNLEGPESSAERLQMIKGGGKQSTKPNQTNNNKTKDFGTALEENCFHDNNFPYQRFVLHLMGFYHLSYGEGRMSTSLPPFIICSKTNISSPQIYIDL